MTIVKQCKKYEINGTTYFVERYAEKPHFVWFWRYGYINKRDGMGYIISDHLFSRPNIKRLFA